MTLSFVLAGAAFAAQNSRYDFSGVLSNCFGEPPGYSFGDAVFEQEAGSLVFHNRGMGTEEAMKVLGHKYLRPRNRYLTNDWTVAIDVTIPRAYDTNVAPESDWMEAGLAVLHTNYTGPGTIEHIFGTSLLVGPGERGVSSYELTNRVRVEPSIEDVATTNETVTVGITFSSASNSLTAFGDTLLVHSISLDSWQMAPEDEFHIALYGHVVNFPVTGESPARMDDFEFAALYDPIISEIVKEADHTHLEVGNLVRTNAYTLQRAGGVVGAAWSDVQTIHAPSDETSFTVPHEPGARAVFYRLRCD